MRVHRNETVGLLSKADSQGRILVWPLAESYAMERGKILPVGGRREGGLRSDFPRPSPLRSGDLVTSFARLGARGNPSHAKILGWVNEYGLLSRADEHLPSDADLGDGRVNQAPMTVEDLRIEVLQVYDILTLYSEIRGEDVEKIRTRIRSPRSWLDDRLADGYDTRIEMPDGSAKINAYTKATILSVLSNARGPELWHADRILCEVLTEYIDSIRLQVVPGFEIPGDVRWDQVPEAVSTPVRRYAPRQSYKAPDLRSAIYLHLYLLVTSNKPMKVCEHPKCRLPFPLTRKNRRFCNKVCKRGARNYR